MSKSKDVSIIGAGLVGSLVAVFLARRGYRVQVFEGRPDMRRKQVDRGRSINLAISRRGLYALELLGLKDQILESAVPMRGRMMHSRDGELTFQPYGKSDDFYINSISRAELNVQLMNAAEAAGARIAFDHVLQSVDFDKKVLSYLDVAKQSATSTNYSRLIGTDGAYSRVRQAMVEAGLTNSEEDVLEHGYKELTIHPGNDGSFQIRKDALHIWPRGSFMLGGLPNIDGSFTGTLYLSKREDRYCFDRLKGSSDVLRFFEEYFSDSIPFIRELDREFRENPVGSMVTVRSGPWFHKDEVLLLGDASHAIVPFFGQGMNCGFEDCSELESLMDAGIADAELFSALFEKRKEHCDAIADMALENFIEMRDRVGDSEFLLKKAIEKKLENEFPSQYVSRYSLVSFTRTPYRDAYDIGEVQRGLLANLADGIESVDQLDFDFARREIDRQLGQTISTKLKH